MNKLKRKLIPIAIAGIFLVSIFVYVNLLEEKSKESQTFEQSSVLTTKSYDEIVRKTVTDNPHANQIVSFCGVDGHCIVESLEELANIQEKQIVLQTIDDILGVYRQAEFYCHVPAHHVGEFLYGYLGDLPEAMALSANRKCGGALFHGVLENYFQSQILLNGLKPDEIEITNICNTLDEIMVQVECAHGLGHGLAKIYNYDVFTAVKRCDELNSSEERRLCAEGMFMANTVENSKTGGGAFDKDDIHFPCNELDIKYAGACYYYQISYILKIKGNAYEAFQECDKIPNEIIKHCYRGMGGQIGTSFIGNIENSVPVCQLGNPDHQKFCYDGVLFAIVDHRGFDESFEACKIFPDSYKKNCYTLLGAWIGVAYNTEDQIQEQCAKAESLKYLEICKLGSSNPGSLKK